MNLKNHDIESDQPQTDAKKKPINVSKEGENWATEDWKETNEWNYKLLRKSGRSEKHHKCWIFENIDSSSKKSEQLDKV